MEENEVEKPKRKYVRKGKVEKVEKVIEKVEKEFERLEILEKQEQEPSQKTPDDIFKEIHVKGYNEIIVYVYFEGNNVDTLLYIKEFQKILDYNNIGSQVVISTKENVEKVGINNCFHSEEVPSDWTSPCLAKASCMYIKIKERPRIDEKELFEFLKTNIDYTDGFIEVLQK